jgi:hypothetical protein
MNTLKRLNDLKVCDLVIKMSHDDSYRMLKSFFYTNDGLQQFIQQITEQLSLQQIHFKIIDSQTIDIPHCSHRGTKYIELASHYRVDIIVAL